MRFVSVASIVCLAGFTAFALEGISIANARQPQGESASQPRASGTPILAIIALAQQRISIYSGSGKLLEGQVSTGATGHETPAGIYSILEKEEEHHSNLYDDASMPFMQRLTWTGISMHAGALPGYPASHGCTRLSYGFAEKLYQITKPGMRVIVVREDITPAEIEQPALFDRALAPDVSQLGINASGAPSEAEMRARLGAIKETKLAAAEAAKKRELAAKSAAVRKTAEAASAVRLVQAAEANLARMEAALDAVHAENDKAVRTPAAAKIEAARLQLERAKAEAQAKSDAAAEADKEAKLAAAASDEAAEAAETARQNAWPISIFVSREAQRLYIRRGREPVFEGPVTIRNPDRPIGTFVFTALGNTGTPGRMRWNVVSMYKNATAIEPYSEAKRDSKKHREPKPADVAGVREALQRLVIPQEALDHISGTLLPGSSLIISDEGAGSETGKDTDFVVFMSGDPKGGATFRSPVMADSDDEKRRSHGHERRTSSARSRHHSGDTVWRRREWSSSSFFGF